MRTPRTALVALAVAAVAAPALAQGQINDNSGTPAAVAEAQPFPAEQARPFGLAAFELEYLQLRERAERELGARELGRDIVVLGFREPDGDIRTATRVEVDDAIDRIRDALADSRALEHIAAGGGYASAATVECESGGDYSIDTGNGYYGAYQFDQPTWDSYAPGRYVGVRPSEVPPEIQDAVAASVTYDAWPNCP